MKRIFVIFVVMLTGAALLANGLSLNSIGTKALGMGGAFVGLADDGTAIYWNPAGLIGQSNAAQFCLTDLIPIVKYEY
ncbi:MAG: hypothetical protein SVM86_05855 [Candidatus Cloacimonadota bacterium]|nr:hypothetical protein [Candidatus Cloacimonadota bacterium]